MNPYYRLFVTGTTGDVWDCERDGHCLHPSTDPRLYWCCKCGKYIRPNGATVERLPLKYLYLQRNVWSSH